MFAARLGRFFVAVLGFVLPAACGDTNTVNLPPFDVRVQTVSGTAGLASPMDLQAPPGDARLFIAERAGRIRIVQGGMLLPTPFLDISGRVFSDPSTEAGLLSFAFDPQYSVNGFVYMHFIEKMTGNNGDIVVERYQVSAGDPNQLDPASVEPVIRIPHHDFSNHYGGRVAFGPDGMLYLSTGDGGNANDSPLANGQNAATLLAALLRIDVSALTASQTPPYAIPADNPVWPGVGRNENWAIGLRNPFRYAFDEPSGLLYIGDVGQNQHEEVDRVHANAAGLNYGWSIMEGSFCFPAAPCDMSGLTLPVYDYDHTQGDCAIIGGYVYRGAAIPALVGSYLFSDLCGGWLRSLVVANGMAVVKQASMLSVGTPVSFGRDGAGELYVLNTQNQVLKIIAP